MDVLAHSLWSIALLPGEQIAGKVIFGILPDLAAFTPNLLVCLIRKKKLPRFSSRQQMMEWFDRKDNRWVKVLYRWTHSLLVWSFIVITGSILCSLLNKPPPWFLLAAPLHILMDIPTHTRHSFPVQFLTPVSRIQINGIHWSRTWILICNYTFIAVVLYFRYFRN